MESSLIPFSTPLPSRRFLAIGSHALSDKMLELIAKLSLSQHVTVLDCGNRSNMYSVAKLIRPYTSDPVRVMCNIRLSRAFTCYQVLAMLQAVAANPPKEPLVVLDRRTGKVTCKVPVFARGSSATENSLVGVGDWVFVENNEGYAGPWSTLQSTIII